MKDVPGPGLYNPRARPTSAAPMYGFGSGTRTSIDKEKTPGPGAYRVPSRIQDVPNYLLPNRLEEFKYV